MQDNKVPNALTSHSPAYCSLLGSAEVDTDTRIGRLICRFEIPRGNLTLITDFQREVEAIKQLQHPHAIVQLLAPCLLCSPYSPVPNHYALIPYVPPSEMLASLLHKKEDIAETLVRSSFLAGISIGYNFTAYRENEDPASGAYPVYMPPTSHPIGIVHVRFDI